MRWALHVSGVVVSDLRRALEAERDHYLATSPIATPELEQINSALRMSYNGPPEVTTALKTARAKHIADNPHPDTSEMIVQMNGAIAGAVDSAGQHAGLLHVSIYGSIRELIGEQTANVPATYGNRVSIAVDSVYRDDTAKSGPSRGVL